MQEAVLGSVQGYVIFVTFRDEHIRVYRKNELCAQETVTGITKFVKKAKQLAFGWGQFANDGDEVISLSDKGEENFGYAVNLDDPQCSAWGYAPFSAGSRLMASRETAMSTHPVWGIIVVSVCILFPFRVFLCTRVRVW